MTISYSGSSFRLLFRWKGSLWKSVWMELLGFLVLYYTISAFYRSGLLDAEQKLKFEYWSSMFDSFTHRVPITFLLGFYVTSVVRRWWEQFENVAWPDDVLSYCNVLFPGPQNRLKRRNIARWLNLTAALAWRDVSNTVRERFQTIDDIVNSGLMTKEERCLYNGTICEVRWLLPLGWIQRVVEKELVDDDNKACSAPLVAHFYRELNYFRKSFRQLYCYDWVCIPLVYTQVAALATYGFFALCLIGRQYVDTTLLYGVNSTLEVPSRLEGREVDLVIPIFTILQFIFYVGWLKVGQYLMRPFEDDDDDFELNYILNRHIQASMAFVDEFYDQEPEPVEDVFMNQRRPHLPDGKLKHTPPKLHSELKSRTTMIELAKSVAVKKKNKSYCYF